MTSDKTSTDEKLLFARRDRFNSRQPKYKDICDGYNCNVKVYPKMESGLKKFGTPDLLVLFTNTVSHKMVKCALSEAKGKNIKIVRSHSGSASALKSILEEHVLIVLKGEG